MASISRNLNEWIEEGGTLQEGAFQERKIHNSKALMGLLQPMSKNTEGTLWKENGRQVVGGGGPWSLARGVAGRQLPQGLKVREMGLDFIVRCKAAAGLTLGSDASGL